MTCPTIHTQSIHQIPEIDDLNENLKITPERDPDQEDNTDTKVSRLQAQLTQIQLELAILKQKESTNNTPKPTSSAQNYHSITSLDNTIKHEKSPTIQPFYGNPKDFDRFFAKINRAFLLAPQRFASNIHCVVYICQHLEGNTVS